MEIRKIIRSTKTISEGDSRRSTHVAYNTYETNGTVQDGLSKRFERQRMSTSLYRLRKTTRMLSRNIQKPVQQQVVRSGTENQVSIGFQDSVNWEVSFQKFIYCATNYYILPTSEEFFFSNGVYTLFGKHYIIQLVLLVHKGLHIRRTNSFYCLFLLKISLLNQFKRMAYSFLYWNGSL